MRDAQRSRRALLEAGEHLFAEKGYDGVSLQDIAAEGGLSRGAPSYFFGSKEGLYLAVIEHAFREREAATQAAFAPVLAWIHRDGDAALRRALLTAAEAYLDFLRERPTFVRLITWEGLSGGRRLNEATRHSAVMAEAFAAVRDQSPSEPQRFEVADAVLVFVSLTFSPMTQRDTFMRSLARDLDDSKTRRKHAHLVVDQLMHLVGRAR